MSSMRRTKSTYERTETLARPSSISSNDRPSNNTHISDDIQTYLERSSKSMIRKQYSIWLVGVPDCPPNTSDHPFSTTNIIPQFVPTSNVYNFAILPDPVHDTDQSLTSYINSKAFQLLRQWSDSPTDSKEWNELLLIGYGLGGVILKQAIILGLRDGTYVKVILRISNLIFWNASDSASILSDQYATLFRKYSANGKEIPYTLYSPVISDQISVILEDYKCVSRRFRTRDFTSPTPPTSLKFENVVIATEPTKSISRATPVKDFLTRELASASQDNAQCHEFLLQIDPFDKANPQGPTGLPFIKRDVAYLHHLAKFVDDADQRTIIKVVDIQGLGESNVLHSLAREFSKDDTKTVIELSRSSCISFSKPEAALQCSFISEILLQRPYLYSRIEYFIKRGSEYGFGETRLLSVLLSAILNLKFLQIVVIIDDFKALTTRFNDAFKALMHMASSVESNLKVVVSGDREGAQLIEQAEVIFDMEEDRPGNEALQAQFGSFFATQPALLPGCELVCDKLWKMNRTKLESFMILKLLSRSGIISAPSALLRHIDMVPRKTVKIYDYFWSSLQSRPAETTGWAVDCLSWVFLSARPLREQEVACGAAISSASELGRIPQLNEYLSADLFSDLDRYAGVFVKQEDGCILPFHNSASDFLGFNSVQARGAKSWQDKFHTHASLTKHCLEYISIFVEDVEIIRQELTGETQHLKIPDTPEHSFLSYACIFWPNHYFEARTQFGQNSEAVQRLNVQIMKFLASSAMVKWYELYRANIPPLVNSDRYELTPLAVSTDLGLVEISLQLLDEFRPPLNVAELDACLDVALKRRVFPVAKRLLELKARGNNALHLAAEIGNASLIDDILANGIEIDSVDDYGSTALHVAVQYRHLEVAKTLLRLQSVRPQAETIDDTGVASVMLQLGRNGNSILHSACLGGDLEIVRWVMATEPHLEVTKRNRFEETPLHLAAAFGHTEVVEFLQSIDADVQAMNTDGNSPLELASRGGHMSVLTLLLETTQPKTANAAFRFAAKHGDLLMIKSLLAAERVTQDNTLPLADNRGHALYLAASHGHANVVEYLLKSGSDPNERKNSNSRRSPLAEAAYEGHTHVIQRLLVGGANINLASGSSGDTPLHYAASRGKEQAVSELLKFKSCNLNARNGDKATPLHLSVMHPQVVERLLITGADQRILDDGDSTPLHKAVKIGCLESVKLLLRFGADDTSLDGSGLNPVNLAILHPHPFVASFLLQRNRDLINIKGGDGQTPLHYAARTEHEDLIAELIGMGADVEAADDEGCSPLHLAAKNGKEVAVRQLLGYKAAPDTVDSSGRTALHHAAASGNLNISAQLLEFDILINRVDSEGKSPLWLACYAGQLDIVQQLLNKGGVSSSNDEKNWTPLHAAYDSPEVVKLLLNREFNDEKGNLDGLGIDDRTDDGFTALMFAVAYSAPDVVKILIDAKANLEVRSTSDSTALHYATSDVDMVKILVEGGADVHARGGIPQPETCLETAARAGEHESVLFLLEKFTGPTVSPASAWAAEELLEALVATSDETCITHLISKSDAMVNIKLDGGYTALQKMLDKENVSAALCMIEKGADPWEFGGPFLSAIHQATHMRVISVEDSTIQSVLEKAISKPHYSTSEALLKFIQLAFELENSELWNVFPNRAEILHNVRDRDGWGLEDFSARAKHPYGLIERGLEPNSDGFSTPSTWVQPEAWSISGKDKNLEFEIAPDGLEVEATSTSYRMSFRANHPFPPRKSGVDYFEITILEGEPGQKSTTVTIGLCSEFANMSVNFAGHRQFSIGYHSDDGRIYDSTDDRGDEKMHTPAGQCKVFGRGDVVGCGVDWDREECFFTLNGVVLYSAKSKVIRRKLYPMISLKRGDEGVRVKVRGGFGGEVVFNLASRGKEVKVEGGGLE
ncbi:Ankyrin repeat-containing protein [Glarea lozoyensis ATCC 20868]|uniref:Ankyrin repeat-containing protein n=1 Tax=Glarea lozoyensis (strain ATCC 20868 / MF5171) TaxID=1116229 RepID=S3CH91_GLAL2|nr:Ankyrin repeat-containing protein [Glarea lozoyensis ATCC 20868]EPE24664.1 Ankyrin repeat-containing protein [Glarea lozoyensis ATCC 20868]